MPVTRKPKTRSRTPSMRAAKSATLTRARTGTVSTRGRRTTHTRRAKSENGRQFRPLLLDDFEALTAKQSPQGKVLTHRCIRFVLNAVPTARISMGQGCVDFLTRRPFCFVVPETDGCRLCFRESRQLFDPQHRLRGAETEERFLRVAALEHLNSYAAGLLQQAYSGPR